MSFGNANSKKQNALRFYSNFHFVNKSRCSNVLRSVIVCQLSNYAVLILPYFCVICTLTALSEGIKICKT